MSNFETGQVEVYSDSGVLLNPAFLNGNPSGGGGGEGIACTSGSSNVMYVANNGPDINAFKLTTGAWITTSYSAGASIAGMTINGAGNLIYAGDYSLEHVVSLQPGGPPSYLLNAVATTSSPDMDFMHDVALGTSPAALAGDLFTSYFPNDNSGVDQFQNVSPLAPLSFQAETLPFTAPYTNGCATFTNGSHCWTRVSGMAFDADGNLWVNSATAGDNGTFEFYQNPSGPPEFLPLNFTPSATPSDFPVGLTIAPTNPPDPNCPGCILTADFTAGTVSIIKPASCTGIVGLPGACTRSVFFTPGGEPKYAVYNRSCPSPDNDGYVEVCKKSNPSYPVTGIFDFTVTAPLFSSGTVEVPVGECSGSIQVPSGTVTITEAPKIGDLVSNVTAYSDNQGGFHIPELISWTAPDLNATVGVKPGGVSGETLATFTNYAAPPGQLKICKIAGAGITVGTPFTFTVTDGPTKSTYTIEAGPADQGGFCELAGSFPVNTQVTVAETVPAAVRVSSITVTQGRGSHQTSNSVVVTILDGITEVDFTDVCTGPTC